MSSPELVSLVTDTATRLSQKRGYQLTFSAPQVELVLDALAVVMQAMNKVEDNDVVKK
jgi:hypothetical protein